MAKKKDIVVPLLAGAVAGAILGWAVGTKKLNLATDYDQPRGDGQLGPGEQYQYKSGYGTVGGAPESGFFTHRQKIRPVSEVRIF